MTQIRRGVEKVRFGPFGTPSDPSEPNFHMREWWPMLLDHNMNPFRSFAVKSNDPNSINSPKSHFWDIFGHIGHLLTLLGQISMVADEIPIIGTVLDHFQPNQMTQIGLGV